MTDSQLILIIGLQSAVTLIGILVNVIWFKAILRRLDRMSARLSDTRLDLLMGKAGLPGLRSN